MSEPSEPSAPQPNPALDLACDIALGRAEPNSSEAAIRCKAAEKDLNCKGKGPWWYRMVWRGGSWQYFSDERLPMGTFLAADRRATVYGSVFRGELVCRHDKGGPVDGMWLVVYATEKPLKKCEYVTRRDGQLSVTLPDGSEVIVPNPRSR